ncbi:hypothetical protein HMSSN139_61790 [Paenibacillus sp. HMSSN-139]|nr:hypothetical protein HMSSN139_61790 [Paenibacillus sp. HMSSN-139]
MLKRVLMTVLTSLIILSSFSVPPKVEAVGSLPTTQDKNDPNKYFFVALFSSDIWRRSDGVTWTGDGSPGGVVNITFPYSFDFPGRKIKKCASG